MLASTNKPSDFPYPGGDGKTASLGAERILRALSHHSLSIIGMLIPSCAPMLVVERPPHSQVVYTRRTSSPEQFKASVVCKRRGAVVCSCLTLMALGWYPLGV